MDEYLSEHQKGKLFAQQKAYAINQTQEGKKFKTSPSKSWY